MFKPRFRILLTAAILFASLASAVGIGYAQEGADALVISVDPLANCGEVQFTIQWTGGTTPSYLFYMDFGDGDSTEIIPTTESSMTISHPYPDQGDFEWTVKVGETGLDGLDGTLTGMLILEGPEVVLSTLTLPLFVFGVDAGNIEFTATVTGGIPPFDYSWDLWNEDKYIESKTLDTDALSDIRSSTYTAVDKYYTNVMVTDACSFTSSDTMPVVVVESAVVCHPMAQKISNGVNLIFPDYSEDIYTCDDIYAIFDNESEENNLGFGLMWKAYHLAESMEILSWEDIMDWKLNESGWGVLLQLDRFTDLLEDHPLPELMDLVMSEDFSMGDVRTAVRSTTRYEADFEDALARIADGANPGELGQFYKLANELGMGADPSELDNYLAKGLTLSELRHAASFADRMEVDWKEIAVARGEADSWGDLGQAYRLATDEFSAAAILIQGVQEYKESLREDDKTAREEKAVAQQEEQSNKTAERLAEQFTAKFGDVMALFNEGGECEGDWGCVRKALRDQEMSEGYSEKDIQTALQIGSKYGYTEQEVLDYHIYCGEDWACTRAYFREHNMNIKETGKPEK